MAPSPPPCTRTPSGGCEGGEPGPFLRPPPPLPAVPCGKGEAWRGRGTFPPSVGRWGAAPPPPVLPEGRGSQLVYVWGGVPCPRRAGLPLCSAVGLGGWQVAGGGPVLRAWGCPAVRGGTGRLQAVCVYRECMPGRWRPQGCLCHCWQRQGPGPLVLGERTPAVLPGTPVPRVREGLIQGMYSWRCAVLCRV